MIKPEDINHSTSKRILDFLNKVEAPEEMVKIMSPEAEQESIEKAFKHELKVARKILDRRKKLGEFRNLDELLSISRVGPVTFSRIIRVFEGDEMFGDGNLERERLEFKALLLNGPGYFGKTASGSVHPESSSSFEELVCLSSNPGLNYVVVVVLIKMENGYTNTRLSKGTDEYISLYADWENKGVWSLVRSTKTTVFDIPGVKPQVRTAMFDIKPPNSGVSGLVKMRVILSWNMKPPEGEADFIPVWGNVLENETEMGPWKRTRRLKLSAGIEPELTPEIHEATSQEQAGGYPADIAQLAVFYQDKNVPVIRFAYPEIWKLLEAPYSGEYYLKHPLEGLTGDIPGIIEGILKASGNSDYEELVYVDLDQRRNLLTGIVKLKRRYGYTGSHYTGSSREYVAFWAWNTITRSWFYLGTSGANVHDIAHVPRGLYYAVAIPVNTEWLALQTGEGSKAVEILTTLSWEVSPPLDPDWKPVWGNHLRTTVITSPSPPIVPGAVYLSSIGETAINELEPGSVMEINPEADLEPSGIQGAPGYSIKVAGFITDPPNVLAGDPPYKYCVLVRRCINETLGVWTSWQAVKNSFLITKIKQDKGGIPVLYDELQCVDAVDNFYTYQEQNNIDQWISVPGNLLAVWAVPGNITGLWEIRLEAKKADGTPLTARVYHKGRPLRQNQVRLRFVNKYR